MNTQADPVTPWKGRLSQGSAQKKRAFLPVRLLSAGTAGVVAGLGFEPWGLWPLTILSLAWLIHSIAEPRSAKEVWLKSWYFGLGGYVISLAWIPAAFGFQNSLPASSGWLALFLLSAYLAIFTAIPFALASKVKGSPLARIAALGALWTVSEWLRGILLTGFPWNQLGIIWIDVPFVSFLGSWVGALGLSTWTVLLAGGLAMLAITPRVAGALVAACLLIAALGHRQSEEAHWSTVRATVVQPNIPQSQKWDPGLANRNLQKHLDLSETPGSATLPRILFWPEAAIPFEIRDDAPLRSRIAKVLGPRDLLLAGGTSIGKKTGNGEPFATNSLFVLDSSGDILAQYDKAHLVPFGEYLPLETILSKLGLTRFAAGGIGFEEGAGPQTIQLPGLPSVAPAICYEIIFPGAVVDKSERPSFIFNPSNDAWFGTSGPPQHLAQARMRSIEEGLPTVRATTTGISAIIGPDGKIQQALESGRSGALDGALPRARPATLFSRHGNGIPLTIAASLLFALLILNAVARPARQVVKPA